MGAIVLVAMLLTLLAAAGPALAGGAQDIINDIQDGTVDSDWSAAQVRAALAYLRDNPLSTQYSDYEGVLEDYLQSLAAPGSVAAGGNGGQLAFTGGEVVLVISAGLGLIGGGFALRRRGRS
jgi:hypothetical protein